MAVDLRQQLAVALSEWRDAGGPVEEVVAAIERLLEKAPAHKLSEMSAGQEECAYCVGLGVICVSHNGEASFERECPMCDGDKIMKRDRWTSEALERVNDGLTPQQLARGERSGKSSG